MKGRHNLLMGLLAAGWLGLAGTVCAGPYVNLMQPCDCPPNHYSAMHVLMPSLWRWAAWCQGPCRYTFARTLHPEVASTYYLKRYHCPSVNPFQFALQNYPGLAGIPPSSSYQSPQTEPKEKTALAPPPRKLTPPEVLPPPSEDPDKR